MSVLFLLIFIALFYNDLKLILIDLDKSGLNWINLDWSGLIWIDLDKSGLIWINLDWSGLIFDFLQWSLIDLDWSWSSGSEPPAKKARVEDTDEAKQLRTVFLSNLDFEVTENQIAEILGNSTVGTGKKSSSRHFLQYINC